QVHRGARGQLGGGDHPVVPVTAAGRGGHEAAGAAEQRVGNIVVPGPVQVLVEVQEVPAALIPADADQVRVGVPVTGSIAGVGQLTGSGPGGWFGELVEAPRQGGVLDVVPLGPDG